MQKFSLISMQIITLTVFIGIVLLLFITPSANSIIWTFVIPLVPITLLLIGYSRWRKVCPLAWFSKIAQKTTFFSKRRLPFWFEQNFYALQFGILYVAFAARLYVLNYDALLLAAFFITVLVIAILSGLMLSGKSWCNYLCPVGVVEKIYTGSNAHMYHLNSACGACTACKNNCPDIDAESAYWKEGSIRQKRFVFYSFPGLVYGFYLYYYLEAGSWSHYFDGHWAFAKNTSSLFTSLNAPGFFFLPTMTKMVAVPLTLAICVLVSYYIFVAIEKMLRRTGLASEKGEDTIGHITKVLAAFIAFNIFYMFAGAPTFQKFPNFYALFHFVIIVTSAVILWKELHREEKFFIQERFARKILKKWNGEEIPSKNLKEIYYTYANQQKDHAQHLENYKETVFELMADGILTTESIKLLDKMRNQLGITLQEHKKIINSLEKEHAELFEENSAMTAEKIFQIKSYTTLLKKMFQENKILNENELENLRKHFNIEIKEHEKILNELVNSDGILKEKIKTLMADLVMFYKIYSLIPEKDSISINYLKFCTMQELEEHLVKLEKMLPLFCSNENFKKLVELFRTQEDTLNDLTWVDESFRPLVDELLFYKNKAGVSNTSGLAEAALIIFGS